MSMKIGLTLKHWRYRFIGWCSLILVLIASGFRAAGTVDPAVKAQLLRIHVPVAIAVLLLTLLRVVWWLAIDRRPDPVVGALAERGCICSSTSSSLA